MKIIKSKDRQHNDQQKTIQTDKHDLQSITHKTKDRVARTQLRTECELRCSGRVSISCFTSGARRVTLIINHSINSFFYFRSTLHQNRPLRGWRFSISIKSECCWLFFSLQGKIFSLIYCNKIWYMYLILSVSAWRYTIYVHCR